MKNTLLILVLSTLAISCNQSEKAHHNAESKTVEPKNNNEMVAVMDEMMDEMHSEKSTGNNDADFSIMMKAHHEGAVDMSELLLQKGKNEELKNFATKVISAQNVEIKLMEKFEDRKEISPDTKVFHQELNQSMGAMMSKEIKIYNDIDKDYAAQMIPHHQSAVDMAKVYLKYGKEKVLLQLCSDIVKTQTTEIAQLKEWLSRK